METKFVSWNVNGLRAIVKKGFGEALAALDADVVCLQETKLQAGQIDDGFVDGYPYRYWSYAERKGYSGTAILARREPIDVRVGIGSAEHDSEGRAVTLEYDSYYLVTVYAPNSQGLLARIDYREAWEDALRGYLSGLEERKPVILCGDMNVARHEIDLRHPEEARGSAGFSDRERQKLEQLIGVGYVDTYRELHPDQEKAYTWWSYQMMARRRNDGWRIDYFLISRALLPHLADAAIYPKIMGSDHCPISITLTL